MLTWLHTDVTAKTLVVYYSYTGNCREIVTTLTSQIQADVLEIQPAEKGLKYEANLRALYYDLAGAHSPEVIRMMLTITTPDHLLYGSDYPYVASQVLTQSLARMKQYLSTEPDLAPFREMILYKNANELFK